MVYTYKGLLNDLDKLESYEAIKDIITPPLSNFQSVDLLKALVMERFALLYKTGLGKTLMASAYMRCLKNIDRNRKFLMFIKNDQLKETPEKVHKVSNLRCKSFDASASNLFTMKDVAENDVIMLTHDCLNSVNVMERLLALKEYFCGVVVDEMHLISNITSSNSGLMLYNICYDFQFVLGLTATPITTDVKQFARMLKILDPVETGNWRDMEYKMKDYGLGAIDSKFHDLFVVRDRQFNNHKGIPIFVEPMKHQEGASGQDLFVITKGPGAEVQGDCVAREIRKRLPLKGILYCNRKLSQAFIVDYLKSKGIRCALINGDIKGQERNNIIDNFHKGEYDILITNIKQAIDLDCDYVIFYEFTVHVTQFIGRAERGLNPKPLDVIFIFTRDTDELDYFQRNILEISQEVQEILGMDLKEVTGLLD